MSKSHYILSWILLICSIGYATVTTTNDSGTGSLRQAIIDANANPGPDFIILPAGNYKLTIEGRNENMAQTGDLDITDDLTIIGSGHINTIIDGNGIDRVFDVLNSSLNIQDITVTGGQFILDESNIDNQLKIDNDDLGLLNTSGIIDAGGGGIQVTSGQLDINQSIIKSNSVTSNIENTNYTLMLGGGGISIFASITKIKNSTLSDNSVSSNNGNSTFHNLGGGIKIIDSNVEIENSTLFQNTISNGKFNTGAGISNIDRGIFGGIVNNPAQGIEKKLTITDSSINGNSITGNEQILNRGGGISNSGSSLIIDTCNITGNSITGTGVNTDTINEGGGIANYSDLVSSPIEITNCNIFSNTLNGESSINRGGGMSNITHNKLTTGDITSEIKIKRSAIFSNLLTDESATENSGGAIFNFATEPVSSGISVVTDEDSISFIRIENTTVSDNRATNSGGGFYNLTEGKSSAAAIDLNSCTVANNQSTNGGGIFNPTSVETSGTVILINNSIIADNIASNQGDDIHGAINSNGFNIIGNDENLTGFSVNDKLNINPLIGPLETTNDDFTLWHPLLKSSPAIDSGNNFNAVTTDQRDKIRPIDADNDGFAVVDIGAYENYPPATINGFVYQDLNNNGLKDFSDPGIAEISLYLDLNNNDRKDITDIKTTTDQNGHYEFSNLDAPNVYTIRLEPKYGIIINDTENNFKQQVSIEPNNIADNQNFALDKASDQNINLDGLEDKDYFGFDIDISKDYAVATLFNLEKTTNFIPFEGKTFLYQLDPNNSNRWRQIKEFVSTSHNKDAFSQSTAIDNDTLIIGAQLDGSLFEGSVTVFEKNNGGNNNWGLSKVIENPEGSPGDNFGSEVDISNNTLAIAAFADEFMTGSVFVYERDSTNSNNWLLASKLKSTSNLQFQNFAVSLSIDGDIIVVGSSNENGRLGAAYVYERNKTNALEWIFTQRLAADIPLGSRQFGNTVAVSNNTIIVGVVNDAGSLIDRVVAYVYEKDPTTNIWQKTEKLSIGNDVDFSLGSASSVAIDNDTIAIGLPLVRQFNDLFGAVYVYNRNNDDSGNWSLAEILSPDKNNYLALGGDVEIDNGNLITSEGIADKLNHIYFFNEINNSKSGKLRLSSNSYDVNENNESLTVTVERISGSTGQLKAKLNTQQDTALDNIDFTPLSNMELIWNDGDRLPKSVTLPITNDTIVNGKRTFSILLEDTDTNSTSIITHPKSALITIYDDDNPTTPLVYFESATLRVREEVSELTIFVILSAASTEIVTVDYTVSGGTANLDSDFLLTEGKVTFQPGKTIGSFNIKLLDDKINEVTETVILSLKNPTQSILAADAEMELQILSDESIGGFVKFNSSDYFTDEGNDTITVFIDRINGNNGPIDLEYTTVDATANAGEDYQLQSGIIKFENGDDNQKNISIKLLEDSIGEGTESFGIKMNFSGSNDSGTLVSPSIATIFIADNEENLESETDSFTDIVPPDPQPTTGTLIVNLQPPAAEGAQWRFIGENIWRNRKSERTILPEGNLGIEFKPIPNWIKPSPTLAVIKSGEVTILDGNEVSYTQGSAPLTAWLTVEILPQLAKDDGAQWRISGEEFWRSSSTASGLADGEYTVEFKTIDGWQTPFNRNVTLTAHNGTEIKSVYVLQTNNSGSISETLKHAQTALESPYYFNGQIQSEIGEGSGFVVRQRVVLTAAHVIFDATNLTTAANVRWLFQRQRGAFEPIPLYPRGAEIMNGYSNQRESDEINNVLTPGTSTLETLNLDAAALYFIEPAGRNGYGGYLRSDTTTTIPIKSNSRKILIGYPTDPQFISENNRGKMHGTNPNNNINFRRLGGSIDRNGQNNLVYKTDDIMAYSGNSGGPLYVETEINSELKFIPTGILLARNQQVLVRAIDRQIIKKIIDAEIRANSLNETILNSGVIITGNQFGFDNFNLSGVRFETSNITVPEGSEAIRIAVRLFNPIESDTEIQFNTTAISATAGSDYIEKIGTVKFSDNSSIQFIEIPIINDDVSDDGEQFRVTLKIPDNNSQNIVLMTPSELTITIDESSDVEVWKSENFSSLELLDSSISGDLADNDLDGIVTLIEYAINSLPDRPSIKIPLTVSVVQDKINNKTYIHVSYIRRRGGVISSNGIYRANGVEYKLEMSENLENWLLAMDQLEAVGLPEPLLDGLTEKASFRILQNDQQKNLFMRLSINRL